MRSWVIIFAISCLFLLYSLCAAAAWGAIPKPGCVKDAGSGTAASHPLSEPGIITITKSCLYQRGITKDGEKYLDQPFVSSMNQLYAAINLILKHPVLLLLISIFPSLRPHHWPTFQLFHSFAPSYSPQGHFTQVWPLRYSTCLLLVPTSPPASHLSLNFTSAQVHRDPIAFLDASYRASHDGDSSSLGLFSCHKRSILVSRARFTGNWLQKDWHSAIQSQPLQPTDFESQPQKTLHHTRVFLRARKCLWTHAGVRMHGGASPGLQSQLNKAVWKLFELVTITNHYQKHRDCPTMRKTIRGFGHITIYNRWHDENKVKEEWSLLSFGIERRQRRGQP